MILIAAAFDAPLMAVLRRWPNRLHAIEMEEVIGGWDRFSFQSACGLRGLRIVGYEREGQMLAVPWPPRLAGMPAGRIRCFACWSATGRMRPRSEWKAIAEAG